MRKNKRKDMTHFDMRKRPSRQAAFLMPLIWLVSLITVRGTNLKVERQGMKGLKPPYLVLSVHQGFADYGITPLSLFPHRVSYVSDVEGFANYGKWLYRKVGCVPTRRFAGDVSLIRNIEYVVRCNGDSIVVFPEARHSNVGTNSKLPESVGKLIKRLKLPVVIQKIHGSYLSAPIWDEQNTRRVPLRVSLERILTPGEIEICSMKKLTELVNRHFSYDEYQWQYENRIEIDYPNRAQGLHRMLYCCPHCHTEYRMDSKGSEVFCNACGKRWETGVHGRLTAKTGDTEFPHIPDWYEWQRSLVKQEIADGAYQLRIRVKIEALPNEKGFVPLGEGVLEHHAEGFTLTIAQTGEVLRFYSRRMSSVHTECDYRGQGDCIVLSTHHCCYYLYALTGALGITKIQFAAEAFYENGAAQNTALLSE